MAELFNNFDFAAAAVQLVGFAAMALDCISFQAKKRNKILFLQMMACVLWVVQMVLLRGYTGAAVNFLAIGRAALFMQKDKYAWARSKWMLYGTIAAFLIAGILTFDGPLSLLPMGAMTISTIALFISDENKIRWLSLLMIPMWFIYDFTMGSVAGVAAETMNFASIIIALYRYRKKKNNAVAATERKDILQ